LTSTPRCARLSDAGCAGRRVGFGIHGAAHYCARTGADPTPPAVAMGHGRLMETPRGSPAKGLRTMSVAVDYEQENERIIVARLDGKEVARIVQVPGGALSFRMEDGSKRGGSVKNIEQAKKQIERYLK
jgi:hypothetical protein